MTILRFFLKIPQTGGGGNSKNSFIKLIHPGQRQFHPPPHFLWAQQNRGVLYLCHDMGYKCREPDSGSNTVSWIAFWLFSYYERFYVLQWWPVSPAAPSPPNIYFIIITKSKLRPSRASTLYKFTESLFHYFSLNSCFYLQRHLSIFYCCFLVS